MRSTQLEPGAFSRLVNEPRLRAGCGRSRWGHSELRAFEDDCARKTATTTATTTIIIIIMMMVTVRRQAPARMRHKGFWLKRNSYFRNSAFRFVLARVRHCPKLFVSSGAGYVRRIYTAIADVITDSNQPAYVPIPLVPALQSVVSRKCSRGMQFTQLICSTFSHKIRHAGADAGKWTTRHTYP